MKQNALRWIAYVLTIQLKTLITGCEISREVPSFECEFPLGNVTVSYNTCFSLLQKQKELIKHCHLQMNLCHCMVHVIINGVIVAVINSVIISGVNLL